MSFRGLAGKFCERSAGMMERTAKDLSRRSDLTDDQRERFREKADYYHDLKEDYKYQNKMIEREERGY